MKETKSIPLCPSSRPEAEDSTIFGVVNGSVEHPSVTYLKSTIPVTEEVLKLAEPVTPTEVFRIASPCATSGCLHFDGQNCKLAQRVAEQLPTVAETLPPCAIRQNCRWFLQEGKAACFRCPQVITDNYNLSEIGRQVAMPPETKQV